MFQLLIIYFILDIYISKQIPSSGKRLYDNSIDLNNKRIYYLLFCILNIFVANIYIIIYKYFHK